MDLTHIQRLHNLTYLELRLDLLPGFTVILQSIVLSKIHIALTQIHRILSVAFFSKSNGKSYQYSETLRDETRHCIAQSTLGIDISNGGWSQWRAGSTARCC